MNLYVCQTCQQISFNLIDSKHKLTCHQEEMQLLIPNVDEDEIKQHEIHVRKVGNFVTIKIGENHQMIDVHHIKFIVLETNQGIQIKYLNMNNLPQASFILDHLEDIASVYAYCNLHGLFKLSDSIKKDV